jgi:hypothetical protein
MSPHHALREIDTLVINTELTLLSITQAIALSFLAEGSVDRIVTLDFSWWPYIITGALVILTFWSRSLMHVLTIIRWPLRLAHNFVYILFAFLESVMFKQIGSVRAWFALSLVGSVLIWLLFWVDLEMVRQASGSDSNMPRGLTERIEKDQSTQLRVIVPMMILLSVVSCGLVFFMPSFFAQEPGHVILASIQGLFLLGYLLHGLRFYRSLLPLIPVN